MRNPLRTMAATTLVLEAFAVFFAALALGNLPAGSGSGGGVDRGTSLLWVGGLALALLLTAGLLRHRMGYVIGSLMQVVVLAVGFWLPMMFLVGAMFVALWVASLWVGLRVERDRASFVADGGGCAEDGAGR